MSKKAKMQSKLVKEYLLNVSRLFLNNAVELVTTLQNHRALKSLPLGIVAGKPRSDTCHRWVSVT